MTSKPRCVLSLSLAAALAACGGKPKAAPTTATGGEGDDPATPFNDAAVKAAIKSSPGVVECGAEPSTTMGAHLEAQREVLKGGDEAQPVVERFMCRAQADDSWECEWSLFAEYNAAPADPCAAAGDAPAEEGEEGEDPCGGEGGSGYMIMFTVKNDGSVVPGTMHCVAPG